MRCNCEHFDIAGLRVDLLAVPLFADEKLDPQSKRIDRLTAGQISTAIRRSLLSRNEGDISRD